MSNLRNIATIQANDPRDGFLLEAAAKQIAFLRSDALSTEAVAR